MISFFLSIVCFILGLVIFDMEVPNDDGTIMICGGAFVLAAMGLALIGFIETGASKQQIIVMMPTNVQQQPQRSTYTQPQQQIPQVPRQVMKKCSFCAEENPASNTICRQCAYKL